MFMRIALVLILFVIVSLADAHADETVSIGGSNAVLLRPSAPKASVILDAGRRRCARRISGGAIARLRDNQLCAHPLRLRRSWFGRAGG